jgi:hypothetical protein
VEERIVTPLGPVLITLQGDDEGVRLERTSVSPVLPDGQHVDGVVSCEIVFTRDVSTALSLSLSFVDDGDPEPGERLECMTFVNLAGCLSVAIRDDEWLALRGIHAEPASYERTAICLSIHKVAENTRLPIALAWRLSNGSIPLKDYGTWLAADLVLPN